MFISRNRCFIPPVRTSLHISLDNCNQHCDWIDRLYLCFILHFLHRKAATARSTSAGTMVEANRGPFRGPSGCEDIQKKAVASEESNHVKYPPARCGATQQMIIDPKLAQVRDPPPPTLLAEVELFNKFFILKRRRSRRPAKRQCVEPPRLIRMQVASGAIMLRLPFKRKAVPPVLLSPLLFLQTLNLSGVAFASPQP